MCVQASKWKQSRPLSSSPLAFLEVYFIIIVRRGQAQHSHLCSLDLLLFAGRTSRWLAVSRIDRPKTWLTNRRMSPVGRVVLNGSCCCYV